MIGVMVLTLALSATGGFAQDSAENSDWAWSTCAEEGKTCSFEGKGEKAVRYGSGDTWTYAPHKN